MKGLRLAPLLVGALSLAGSLAAAQAPSLSLSPSMPHQLGTPFEVVVQGTPGDVPVILFSEILQPTKTPFGLLEILPQKGMSFFMAPINARGESRWSCNAPTCDLSLAQSVFYGQALTFSSLRPKFVARGVSDLAIVEFVTGDVCPPCAEDAATDPKVWAWAPHSEALYLPGCGSPRYSFVAPGSFTEYDDGTARLTGEVYQNDDPNKRFDVDVFFSGRESLSSNSGVYPPPMSPKLSGVLPSALAVNGGPIDPSEWHYYTALSGTLTGLGDYAGTTFDVQLTGPAAQVGHGGSLKNADYGLSCWIALTRTSGNACTATFDGDINIVITDECP